MLFVLPFSRHDQKTALDLVEWIAELNGKIPTDCVAICSDNCDPTIAKKIQALLASVFNRACLCPIVPAYKPDKQDTSNGWPGGPNLMFRTTCEQLVNPPGLKKGGFPERVRDHDSFYYCEPDNTMLKKVWWDELNAEYDRVKALTPCMGAMNLHNRTDYDGVHRAGEHMVGTGIYPIDIWNKAPLLRTAKEIAWDTWACAEIMPMAHKTDLIQHRHGTRHYFTQDIVSEKAVVLHGCKDGSLLKLVRGVAVPRPRSFLHHGDLGDIISALPAMKYLAAEPAILYLSDRRAGQRETMTPARIDAIRPLLEAQGYISEVRKHDGEPVDVDFWGFRSRRGLGQNLAWNHLDFTGCKLDEHQKTWLDIPEQPPSGKIVIHRSPRYHNPRFPWKEIIQGYGQETLVFVGSQSECDAFNAEFGCQLNFHKTDNLLELAKVIKALSLFIGNQSCPFWVAAGMKHPLILEAYATDSNCVFEQPNAQFILDQEVELPSVPNPKYFEEDKSLWVSAPVESVQIRLLNEEETRKEIDYAVAFLREACKDESLRPHIRMRLAKIGVRKRKRRKMHAAHH